MSTDASPTVLVASDDHSLLDEIVGHLHEIPHWKLVTSVGSVSHLVSALESHLPDAFIVSEGLAIGLCQRPNFIPPANATLIVVGREEQTSTLRAALKLGARGFVLWPKEKHRLRDLAESPNWKMTPRARSQGSLHAVWSPKGGSGASVVAAHLAASIANLGAACTLVDLDLTHADQTAILGAESQTQNVLDLVRMADELSKSIVESVLVQHPEGFKAVLAPGGNGDGSLVKPVDLLRILPVIRESTDHVLIDVPSGLGDLTETVLHEASGVIMILTPDLLSLRRARDTLKSLLASGLERSHFRIVLNQTGIGGLTAKDVKAVLGSEVAAELRADLTFYQAANKAELSSTGKKMLAGLASEIAGAGMVAAPARRRFGIRPAVKSLATSPR